ncbi:MAG: hypothetical protein LBN43_06280 [Oscillospiraceae bacterium]|jgi:hypothetical protein|nr:hypothetical protein [Oscillospiraceae bacterium]
MAAKKKQPVTEETTGTFRDKLEDNSRLIGTEAYKSENWLTAAYWLNSLGDEKTPEEWNQYAYSLWALAQAKPWQAASVKAAQLDPADPKIVRNYNIFNR